MKTQSPDIGSLTTLTTVISQDSNSIRLGAWRDWLGVTASITCAIHCAAMPFVIGALPLLGLQFLADATFHRVMVVICLGLALLAFVPGWRRHRKLTPALVATAGLAMISVAAFVGEHDCCPPSTVDIAAADSNLNAPALGSTDTNNSANCSATGCTGCVDPSKGSASSNQNHATAMTAVWPWVTPMGGVLLIVAHLRNRHWSCRCRCASDCQQMQ